MRQDQGQDVYYFAYGSNLNAADWRHYCERTGMEPGGIEAVGTAVLPDMQLVFDYYSVTRQCGVLDLQPATGHIVHGVLFRVSAQGWKALDTKEGAPHCYERVKRTALRPDGSLVPVITYEVTKARREGFCPPNTKYLDIVRAGLQAWGLPSGALEDAAENRAARIEIDRVFVYGTLMRNQRNAYLIASSEIREMRLVRTQGVLFDTGMGYPAMSLSAEGAGNVFGECVQISRMPNQLQALDALEGFGGYDDPAPLYRRTIVNVTPMKGEVLRAWCYVSDLPDLHQQRIGSGCWLTHCETASNV